MDDNQVSGFEEGTGVPPAKVVTAADDDDFPGDRVTSSQGQEPSSSVPSQRATELAAYDFGDDAGAGTEGMRIEEQLTPFLSVLQGLSPQTNSSKPEFVENARMGMLYNSAVNAVYDGAVGIEIMACWRDYQFTEWVPRDDYKLPDGTVIRGGGGGGGGFRGIHSPDDRDVRAAIAEAVQRFGKGARFRPIPFRNALTEEDTTLIEQFNLGVIYGAPNLTPETARRAMIAFTSTKIGVYKQYITAATDIAYPNPRRGEPNQPPMIKPPLWAHRWRVTTVPQSNKKGDFFNYRLQLAERGPPQASLVRRDDPLYVVAREFYELWTKGQVKADYDAAGGSDAATDHQEDIPL